MRLRKWTWEQLKVEQEVILEKIREPHHATVKEDMKTERRAGILDKST